MNQNVGGDSAGTQSMGPGNPLRQQERTVVGVLGQEEREVGIPAQEEKTASGAAGRGRDQRTSLAVPSQERSAGTRRPSGTAAALTQQRGDSETVQTRAPGAGVALGPRLHSEAMGCTMFRGWCTASNQEAESKGLLHFVGC